MARGQHKRALADDDGSEPLRALDGAGVYYVRHLILSFLLVGSALFSTFVMGSLLQRVGQVPNDIAGGENAAGEYKLVYELETGPQAQWTGPVPSNGEFKRAGVGRSRTLHGANDESSLPYTIDKDIAYGGLPRQKLDLFTPKKPRADGKAVVFFYGGGFNQGNKEMNEAIGKLLASEGIVTVIPDYRLFPDVRFPVFIEDSALAVRWAADHIGVEKLFLMGHSAGAYIAMMLVANSPYLAKAGVERMRLRGAIGLSGPYDTIQFEQQPYLLEVFQGSRHPGIYPETFVNGPLPSVLLAQGMADSTVDPGNTERMAEAWHRSRGQAVVKLYSGATHMDTQESLVDTTNPRIPIRRDVLKFIETH